MDFGQELLKNQYQEKSKFIAQIPREKLAK